MDGVSLDVPSGSFFALLGPSGCGKTTTLRMVAGLERPTGGRILLGDEDITDARPYRRPVNTVFQSYALFPHLDVFENVAFGLRRRRAADVRRQGRRGAGAGASSGHLAQRKPAQLSGGQQQRVALARAVVNRPDVLLLDEPLGALDLKLRRQMQLELKRIQTEVGITFVHVTHDQEEAMTMADTIAVMNAGRIEQLGSPVDLYESPATAYVANFLGQSNLLPPRWPTAAPATVLVEVDGARLAVPAERCRSTGRDVLVGIRPGEGAPGARRQRAGRRQHVARRRRHRRELHRHQHPVRGAAAVRAAADRVRAEHRPGHGAAGRQPGHACAGTPAHTFGLDGARTRRPGSRRRTARPRPAARRARG